MTYDYVLVGGGLQNALLSLGIFHVAPGARVALLEREPRLAGNHTWSFHWSDVSAIARRWLAPIVVADWSAYEVRFPGLRRTVQSPYASIAADRVAEHLTQRFAKSPGSSIFLNANVVAISAREVQLEDGRVVTGSLVVDARGPELAEDDCQTGYQKFVGVELQLDRPLAPALPILMDATVPQRDGFRFVYVLPFAPDRVLVEDTYFSDSPALDEDRLRDGCLDYAAAALAGASTTVVRKERGVLPMPWSRAPAPTASSPLLAGYRGGWLHPATGYSLPIAARLAEYLAGRSPTSAFGADFDAFLAEHRRQSRFCRFLNWLSFRGYPPDQRWRVLERFYRLPEDRIARFYAMTMTAGDRRRILCGRPPRGFSARALLGGRRRA